MSGMQLDNGKSDSVPEQDGNSKEGANNHRDVLKNDHHAHNRDKTKNTTATITITTPIITVTAKQGIATIAVTVTVYHY